MKLDMEKAWGEAVRLLGANKDVVLVVAGVFFFLPYIAVMLLLPTGFATGSGGESDPKVVLAALEAFFAKYWWVFLISALIQAIGVLGMMNLLTDRSRPTLAEALAAATRLLPTYIAAQVLQGLAVGLGILIPIALAATSGVVAVTILVGLIAAAVGAYLFVKFSLSSPVIAIEKTTNPVAALRRSWSLTKGNSLRIFMFTLLLFIAFSIVSAVASMILGLGFALLGSEAAKFGEALVSSLFNAAYVAIFTAVLVAIHRQLAGTPAMESAVAFE